MKLYVVDASVGAKWCLPSAREPFHLEANALLESFRLREIQLIVPDLFWVEIGNALWKSVRRMKISPQEAIVNFSALRGIGILTLASGNLIPEALRIAVAYDRTVYDSLYVALAIDSAMEMITADERLANALAAYFPVKWLGTFQI